MATSTWFVMIPPTYASKSTAEKDLYDFRVQYPAGSQAWNDANAGKILSASESGEGQQLVKWQGPFATEAQAKTAQNPKQQSVNPVNDAVNAAQNSTTIGAFLGPVTTFLADITSAHFWERAGQVVLGFILISVGLAHITHAVPVASAIAKKVGVASAMLA